MITEQKRVSLLGSTTQQKWTSLFWLSLGVTLGVGLTIIAVLLAYSEQLKENVLFACTTPILAAVTALVGRRARRP
jgi:heme/copper-type cytochrome/quinol oxidase subunit 4